MKPDEVNVTVDIGGWQLNLSIDGGILRLLRPRQQARYIAREIAPLLLWNCEDWQRPLGRVIG